MEKINKNEILVPVRVRVGHLDSGREEACHVTFQPKIQLLHPWKVSLNVNSFESLLWKEKKSGLKISISTLNWDYFAEILKKKWGKSTDVNAEFHWNQSEWLSTETQSRGRSCFRLAKQETCEDEQNVAAWAKDLVLLTPGNIFSSFLLQCPHASPEFLPLG